MTDEPYDRWIGLYVPSKTKAGENLSDKEVEDGLAYARERFVNIFDGLTGEGARNVFEKSELHGVYRAEDKTCITERIVLIYAYYPSSKRGKVVNDVNALAEELGDKMAQQCMAVVESGESSMSFVYMDAS